MVSGELLSDEESYSSVDERIYEETYQTYKAAMEPNMRQWYLNWARENRHLTGRKRKRRERDSSSGGAVVTKIDEKNVLNAFEATEEAGKKMKKNLEQVILVENNNLLYMLPKAKSAPKAATLTPQPPTTDPPVKVILAAQTKFRRLAIQEAWFPRLRHDLTVHEPDQCEDYSWLEL